jgi:hypothetical protein
VACPDSKADHQRPTQLKVTLAQLFPRGIS